MGTHPDDMAPPGRDTLRGPTNPRVEVHLRSGYVMHGILRSAPGAPVASPYFWLEDDIGRTELDHAGQRHDYFIPWTSVDFVAID